MEATDSLFSRMRKHVDALNAKLGKLTDENARLKQQLAELKASTSRIRRIPRKGAAASEQPADSEAQA